MDSIVRPVCWHPVFSGNSGPVECGRRSYWGSLLRARERFTGYDCLGRHHRFELAWAVGPLRRNPVTLPRRGDRPLVTRAGPFD